LSTGVTSMLSESELNRVCRSIQRGAKLLVGRDHAGRQKIKLVKGPFGLFVERIECNEEDMAFIRHRLKQSVSPSQKLAS
jgi:hypothetical protein